MNVSEFAHFDKQKTDKFVDSFVNKKNHKSQAILTHMGLVEIGENKNGNSFYYKGNYSDLLSKYNFCQKQVKKSHLRSASGILLFYLLLLHYNSKFL